MRRRAWAAVAMAALLMSGCASIPDAGSVRAGNPVEIDDPIELDIVAQAPRTDASPEQIVRGFIDAAASPRNNYQVAQDFLAPGFEWNPEAGVTIDQGTDRTFDTSDDAQVAVDVRPIAEVSDSGEYRAVGDARVELDYELTQVEGQWRVSDAPQGILLDEATFSLVFSSHRLYFFDPDFSYLVPDVRWFPRRESTQTSIVRALIAGPSAWLAPAVVSAIPDGARLDADAVPVTGSVASVDLSGAAFDDRISLQRMKLQLSQSLSTVRSVRSVNVTINGAPADIPDLENDVPTVNPRVDSRTAALIDGAFGYLSSTSGSISTIPGLSETIQMLEPTGVALGVGNTAAAVRTADGVYAVRTGEAPVLLDSRDNLITPAIDGSGIIWSVPERDPGALTWFDDSGASGTIDVPWRDASAIASIDVSRDGTRLLALLSVNGGTRFSVAGIVRADDGEHPKALGDTLDFATVDGAPQDAAWLDAVTVASLTDRGDGDTVLIIQEIGGASSTRSSAEGAVSVVGGNLLRDLRVLTRDGELSSQSGVGWQVRATDVTVIATQQGVG